MDSKAEFEENVEQKEFEESDAGVVSLALAVVYISKSIFNAEENDFPNSANKSVDDYAPTYCFMAKGEGTQTFPL